MSDKLLSALAHGATLERVLRFTKIPNPGAGAQFTFRVPGESVAQIIGVTGTYTPDATVATRQPFLNVGDGSTVFLALAAGATLVASQPALLSFVAEADNVAGSGAGGVVTTPIPPMILPAGFQIASAVTAGAGGDTWTNVVVWWQEVLSQPFGVHELRVAMELAERLSTSGAQLGGM